MRLSKFTALTMAALFSAGAVSCSDGPDDPNKDDNFVNTPLYEISMTADQTRAAEAMQKGAASQVYSRIEKAEANENVCYSPFSLQMAFSMFLHDNGSTISGEDINKYMDFFGTMSMQELEQLNGMLLTELPKVDGRVKFTLANSLWTNSDFIPTQPEDLPWMNSYKAEKFFLSFANDDVVRKVNDWSLKNTNNRIKLLNESSDFSSFFKLYINALHFIGKWAIPFEESSREMEFTDAVGNTKQVKGLEYSNHSVKEEGYEDAKRSITGNSEGRLFAKMPFGNGGYNMYAVLPAEGESIADCAEFLNDKGLRLEDNAELSNGHISIPAFESNFGIGYLSSVLADMGLPTRFYEGDRLALTADIIQKTFFKMTKDGAEGAGVTMVAASTGTNLPSRIDVTFNRPFIYYVMEQSTGTVLFIGSVKTF